MTQLEFARILGVSQGTVAKYESGLTTPKARVLCLLARLAGRSLENFLEDVYPYGDGSSGDEGSQDIFLELVSAARQMSEVQPSVSVALLELYRAILKNSAHHGTRRSVDEKILKKLRELVNTLDG